MTNENRADHGINIILKVYCHCVFKTSNNHKSKSASLAVDMLVIELIHVNEINILSVSQ